MHGRILISPMRLLAFLALALSVCTNALGEYIGYNLDVWSPVDRRMDRDQSVIRAMALRGDTVYIGGTFNYIGPDTGHGAVFDFDTGQLQPPFPRLDGEVYGVCGDGHGGRFVAGAFTQAGCAFRQGLAHIQAGGAIDRKSVGEGKRGDLGGRRIIKKKKPTKEQETT